MIKKSLLAAFCFGAMFAGISAAETINHGKVSELQSGMSYEYTLDNNDAYGVDLVNQFPMKVRASCTVSGENTATDILITVTKGGGKVNDLSLSVNGTNNVVLPVVSHQKFELLANGDSSVNLKNVGTMPVTAVCKIK